jgi:DNA-binding HxlR family transcriptional regulator
VTSPGPRACSIALALDVIGERWSLLVVRELTLGVHRFNDIASRTGAPRDILTARLRKLVEVGIVERRAYSDKPPRYDYLLTEAGLALRPVLQTLRQWGDSYAVSGPPPVRYVHDCGNDFVPRVDCAACGEPASRESLHRQEVGTTGAVD